MKVIFVVPNLGPGGAERVISILSNSFVENDIDVDIFLLRDNRISYQLSERVNIVYFNIDLLSCAARVSCRIMREYFKNQKRNNDKVIIIPFLDTCLKHVLVSSIGLKIPVIASERNDPYQKGTSLISRIKANIPYLLASCCVFQTKGAKEYYCGWVRRKGHIIMNPLIIGEDVEWQGQTSKHIVSVGRLEPQKNQLLLIDAFSHIHNEYPEYILEIYGEGTLREKLKQRIEALGLGEVVFLCGHSPDIQNVLVNAYLFVLPSDYEGMSNALIEALSIGMPVVTTDHPCGGARMLVDNGINGILVPVKHERAMICAVKNMLENQAFASQIGKEAYKVRELLSVQKITKEWLNVIESM